MAGNQRSAFNQHVDAVLQCLYAHAKSRPIILSSKNPDVCMMLSLKQPHYPVFFITSAGVRNGAGLAQYQYSTMLQTNNGGLADISYEPLLCFSCGIDSVNGHGLWPSPPRHTHTFIAWLQGNARDTTRDATRYSMPSALRRSTSS